MNRSRYTRIGWAGAALAVLMVPGAGEAGPADLDATFGTAGTVRLGFGAGEDFGNAMIGLGGGQYLVAGSTEEGVREDILVIRCLGNGSPDPAFGVNGIARLSSGPQSSASASAMALLGDGRILLAGRDNGVPVLARLMSDGTPDVAFGTGGILPLPGLQIHTIVGVAQQGARMVLCTSFIVGGTYHLGLARVNENGTLDVTFDGDGIARFPVLTESFATGMTVQPDGKFVIVGYAQDTSFRRAVALVRCDANGVPDAAFDGDGIVTTYAGSGNSYGYAVGLQGNSVGAKVIVVGDYGPAAGPRNALIIRYNGNGTLDPTFGPASGTGIVIQPIGAGDDTFRSVTVRYSSRGSVDRIIAAGSTKSGTSGNIADVTVCQYLLTGALDTAISGDGIIVASASSTDDRANTVLTASSRIVTAGFSGFGSGNSDVLLMAWQTSNGAPDPTLDGDGIRTFDVGNATSHGGAVACQADGKLLLAGTASNSLPAMVVARLAADGSPDASFSGDGRASVTFGSGSGNQGEAHDLVVPPDGRIIVGGTVGSYPSLTLGVARLLADGTPDPSFAGDGTWQGFASEEGWGMALQPDGAILIAGNSVGSSSRLRLTRLTSAGAADPSFGSFGVFETLAGGSQAGGRDVVLLPDGRIIVTGWVYPAAGLPARLLILRVTSAGVLDPSFGTGGMTTVDVGPLSDVALGAVRQPDGRLVVCGLAYKTTSTWDACVVRLDADGHLDPAFSGDGIHVRPGGDRSESFQGLALQSDGRILLAGISTITSPSASDQLVVRLMADGNPDVTFGTEGARYLDSGSPGDGARGIAPVPDGRILVVGTNGYLISAARLAGGPSATAVPEPGVPPSPLRVGLPWPNPTSSGTTVEYEVPAGAAIDASVFDPAGRLVRRLPVVADADAIGRIAWDGAGAEGARVSSGVYFIRVRAGDSQETRRVVVR